MVSRRRRWARSSPRRRSPRRRDAGHPACRDRGAVAAVFVPVRGPAPAACRVRPARHLLAAPPPRGPSTRRALAGARAGRAAAVAPAHGRPDGAYPAPQSPDRAGRDGHGDPPVAAPARRSSRRASRARDTHRRARRARRWPRRSSGAGRPRDSRARTRTGRRCRGGARPASATWRSGRRGSGPPPRSCSRRGCISIVLVVDAHELGLVENREQRVAMRGPRPADIDERTRALRRPALARPRGERFTDLVELVGPDAALPESSSSWMRAVVLVVEQDAVGAAAVAAGAARLLHVLLERRRRLVVDDVADVGLVDAEAEGAGRDHHDLAAPRLHVHLLLVLRAPPRSSCRGSGAPGMPSWRITSRRCRPRASSCSRRCRAGRSRRTKRMSARARWSPSHFSTSNARFERCGELETTTASIGGRGSG